MSIATAGTRESRHPHVSAEDRAVQLFGLLRGVGRVELFQRATIGIALALASLVGAALIAILGDAVLALPSGVRLAIDIALVAAAVAVVVWLTYCLVQLRFDARRVARQVECRLNIGDSLLINAVEFAAATDAGDSPVLRERVVRLAEERARHVSALDVLPFRPMWKAFGWCLLAVCVAAAGWLAAPNLFATVVPRYLDPFGDHPPFTLVTFDVSVTPDPVYHGRPATISAVLGGPERVEQADVVLLPADPANDSLAPQRVTMFRKDAHTFSLEIERAEGPRRFYIDTPQGRSRTLPFPVVEVPFFEGVTVRYEYPAYTGWTAQEQPLDARGLRGLVGTEAVLTARSNLPLQSGRIDVLLKPDATAPAVTETLHMSPLADDPRAVQVRVPLASNGSFAITLKARSGGESLEPQTGTITAVADRPPRVTFVEPQPHVICVEKWQVPVIVEAVDDVGIAALRLSRSVNGWGPSTVDLPRNDSKSGAIRSQYEFDLEALGARAGDVITYYATAEDNHPSPPHFADSPTYVIQVISEEDYVQFARQQYQIDDLTAEFQAIQEELDQLTEQRENALEELAELQQQLAQDPDDPALQAEVERLQKQLEQLAEQATTLADKLQERAEQMQLYEFEQPYTEGLKQLSEELQQQSQAAQAVAEALERLRREGNTPENQRALQEAVESLQKQQAGLDQEAQEQRQTLQEDLELFEMADRLLAQAERLKSVIQQQRDLATRFGEFQNRTELNAAEQQRADQLAKQQELLEQELQEIARELEAGADAARERLPQMSASAREIAQTIRDQQIPVDQQQAAAGARQGAGREAFDRSDAAARKLEALAGKAPNGQSAAGEMSGGLDGPLSLSADGLQRSLEQMAQGRSLPGLPRPGQGEGQPSGEGGSGQSSQAGNRNGPSARWRPGQTFPGSQSKTPILGPRTLVEREQPQPGGQLEGNERGSFLPGRSADPLGDAELLTPEARDGRASSEGSLRGVPVPYRKDAEAYFQRLAEDEAAR